MQIKYAVYNNYGIDKDKVKDLVMFISSNDKKYTTLKEYVSRMKDDQKDIFYACGETIDKIDLLPQVEAAKAKGYEILYCTEYVDEFALMTLRSYEEKNLKMYVVKMLIQKQKKKRKNQKKRIMKLKICLHSCKKLYQMLKPLNLLIN